MQTPPLRVRTARFQPVLLLASFGAGMEARAVVTVFFDASQSTNLVAAGTTSDTIGTEGYLFACTRDKLFTGGVGLTEPIGRNLRIHGNPVATPPDLIGDVFQLQMESAGPREYFRLRK